MTALPLRRELTETTVLAVPGMHCAGCISKIERGLADRPGIVSAPVKSRGILPCSEAQSSVPRSSISLRVLAWATMRRAPKAEAPRVRTACCRATKSGACWS